MLKVFIEKSKLWTPNPTRKLRKTVIHRHEEMRDYRPHRKLCLMKKFIENSKYEQN
jgi:hypothetical protein